MVHCAPIQARYGLSATTVGHFALFAGGVGDLGHTSSVVDIYNADTGQWSVAGISVARTQMGATSVGNFAIFAGGNTKDGSDPTDAIDIFNGATGQWSTAKLTQHGGFLAATSVGTKALFAGGLFTSGSFGGPSDSVDIFDAVTGRWSMASLSAPNERLAATAVGTKALFGGGGNPLEPCSDVVDVYDSVSGQWSTAMLSTGRCDLTATTVGNQAIFAGGQHLGFVADDAVDLFADPVPTPSLDGGIGATTDQSASLTIHNGGDQALAPFTVDVYGARDGHRSVLLGTISAKRSLRVGQSREVSVPLTFPKGTSAADFQLVAAANDSMVFAAQIDTAPPIATFTAEPLENSPISYSFTVSYHDSRGVDAGSLNDNDIIVTGPNGFEAPAQFVAQTRGKHASTRIARYTIHGPGRRWDVSDNGVYTIHLQAGEVTDTGGVGVAADRIGTFTVAIPATSQASSPTTTPNAATTFQTRRKIDDLFWQ